VSKAGCICYHPLFVFNQFGDLERCALRSGNVHSADAWHDVLEPVVARYRNRKMRRFFRADAAFANPDVCEFLGAEGYKYMIRLPANQILQERIAHLLKRPVGRPPIEVRRCYANFSYRAQSWKTPRRAVAKVEWHPGELYPRVGFIMTNLSRPAERVVAFYNGRGTAEQWIKQGQERGEVDAAVLLLVRRQHRAAATPRARVQSCKLPADPGAAERHREMVTGTGPRLPRDETVFVGFRVTSGGAILSSRWLDRPVIWGMSANKSRAGLKEFSVARRRL
jgi:hypothetical protein